MSLDTYQQNHIVEFIIPLVATSFSETLTTEFMSQPTEMRLPENIMVRAAGGPQARGRSEPASIPSHDVSHALTLHCASASASQQHRG